MPLTKQEIADIVKCYYVQNLRSPRLIDISKLPFSKKHIVATFGTWNRMLLYSNVPLNRHPPVILQCTSCRDRYQRQVKEIKKSIKNFCSNACKARYYTTGRKHSEETKRKISESLKAHRIFT